MTDAAETGSTVERLLHQARSLDEADPLRSFRDRFVVPDSTDVVAYLDENSLGRPAKLAAERMDSFVRGQWADRLIRGWGDEWMRWPEALGDRIGRCALGAATGQVVVADSTSVLLYKLARAAISARPDRREILLDSNDFPTDRYILEGISGELGMELRWITTDPAAGITAEQVTGAVGPNTALAAFSHTSYLSGQIADAHLITRAVHDAGALVLWDLSHSAGSVPVRLDEWGADFAVGCTYKYLCGGPGSPAFGYVNHRHHGLVRQPIWGWIGRRDPFAMEQGYEPATGVRGLLSGTPPALAMVPLSAGVELLEEAGIASVRAKSLRLTEYALDCVDSLLAGTGVELASPREPDRRGSHITIRRSDFREVTGRLWERGVIPDFRAPDSIRIGLAPLSTSFVEVHRGMVQLAGLAGSRQE